MSNCPPTPIALFNLHCKHVNFWHAHQLLYFYVHTLTHDLFGMPIILNCPWSRVHARISSAKLLLLAHCMIMLNIPYSRCKRLWKGFWSIILVSSSKYHASLKSKHCWAYWHFMYLFIIGLSDMEFVQNFTPPDFQAKDFTPSISPNFNSFSKKKHKKWVKMEKFTPLAKILHCRR